MMSQRQLMIIMLLIEMKGNYLSSSKIAEQCGISVRTVKTEIDYLKSYLKENNYAELTAYPSKGYQLNIIDSKKFDLFLKQCQEQSNVEFTMNEQSIRLKYIIWILLNSRKYISKNKLLDELNVSESTLYLDMKEIKKKLEKYKLELKYRSHSGYIVVGKEENKRNCLTHEEVCNYSFDSDEVFSVNLKTISCIKKILIEIFLKNQYKISESLFESLIIHLLLTLQRIEKGYLIEEGYSDVNKDTKEYYIATEIYQKCISSYNQYNLDFEIAYLAVNLSGKRDYVDYENVSKDIIDFIANSLDKIKLEFGVDFSRSIDLKVALALHFVPLLSRAKNNMQLKNLLLKEIKQSFPIGFDIAQYFSILIDEKYHIQISEDECAYFTLYFNYGLEGCMLNSNGKKILIISRLRQSETILLRQKIYQWFEKQILQLDFVNPIDLAHIDVSYYDVLFTTENNSSLTQGAAVNINLFPTEKDFSKMNLAINGYDSIDSVLNCFPKELFYAGKADSRLEIVHRLIDMATQYYDLPPRFEKLVWDREELSSSYFANHVAIPHPLYPSSPQTFIAVAVLDKSLCWNEQQEVQIVLLVSTEMNNPKAFQIWPYLSSLICNENMLEQVLKEHTYENFIKVLRLSLLDKF